MHLGNNKTFLATVSDEAVFITIEKLQWLKLGTVRNFSNLELSVKLVWTKRCNLETGVHARLADFFKIVVIKSCARFCDIDLQISFLALAIASKNGPKPSLKPA